MGYFYAKFYTKNFQKSAQSGHTDFNDLIFEIRSWANQVALWK